MTEQQFQSSMRAAKTFQGLSDAPNDSDFWSGYQRGLRRLYHGEKFGTENEHLLWLSLVDSVDEASKAGGRGYRAGFEGQTIQQAMLTLAGPRTETCLRCGYSWPPRVDTPARCPACKSQYWNKPLTKSLKGRE